MIQMIDNLGELRLALAVQRLQQIGVLVARHNLVPCIILGLERVIGQLIDVEVADLKVTAQPVMQGRCVMRLDYRIRQHDDELGCRQLLVAQLE